MKRESEVNKYKLLGNVVREFAKDGYRKKLDTSVEEIFSDDKEVREMVRNFVDAITPVTEELFLRSEIAKMNDVMKEESSSSSEEDSTTTEEDSTTTEEDKNTTEEDSAPSLSMKLVFEKDLESWLKHTENYGYLFSDWKYIYTDDIALEREGSITDGFNSLIPFHDYWIRERSCHDVSAFCDIFSSESGVSELIASHNIRVRRAARECIIANERMVSKWFGENDRENKTVLYSKDYRPLKDWDWRVGMPLFCLKGIMEALSSSPFSEELKKAIATYWHREAFEILFGLESKLDTSVTWNDLNKNYGARLLGEVVLMEQKKKTDDEF